MTTNYDTIAEQYKRSKLQPWRAHVEAFTLMELVGELDGQRVLDVACGEGFYTRLLRQQGAAQITGVDLSPGMIDLAREEEARRPLGIEYRVGDARELQFPADRDLVVAAYLLNYARNREELRAMCRGVAGCLRRGGRFVTVNCSPSLDFPNAPSYRKYGFETAVVGGFVGGAPITWTFFLEEGPFQIENYYLDVATHESVFREAGFREVRWHPPRLAPGEDSADHRLFWEEFLLHPPVAFIECVK